MRTFWAIAIGAAVGGVSRYYLSAAVQHRMGSTFPWGTLIINVTGSVVLGLPDALRARDAGVSVEMRALLTTGFCGGYTTFSTYSYETATLIEDGQLGRAGTYALASVLVALAGTFGGFALAREVIALRERV